jgi:hypothetical protein
MNSLCLIFQLLFLNLEGMKRVAKRFIVVTVLSAVTSMFVSCKKEGCTDNKADNYDEEAEKENESCVYPTFSASLDGKTGEAHGLGGHGVDFFSFEHSEQTFIWDIAQSATQGSFGIMVQDAQASDLFSYTLTAGSGPQFASGETIGGTTGTWYVTVTVTNFLGSGEYNFQ